MPEKIKVIYIAGAGRSGTTLLDMILSTSDQVFSVGEAYNFNNIASRDSECGCGRKVSSCCFWRHFYARKDKFKINNHLNVKDYFKILNHLYNPLTKNKSIFFNNGSNYLLLKHIKDNFFKDGKGYILDSSKETGRMMELAGDENFDVFCIHLVRDGRGVANSCASKRGRSSQNFYLALMKWIFTNILMRKFLKINSVKSIHISYDRFCQKPEKYIGAMEKYLGITIPSNYVEIIRTMSYHNIGGNRISKKINRENFSNIRIDTGWKKELSLLQRIASAVICYPFNRQWIRKDDLVRKNGILYNIKIHDKVFKKYEKEHGDIYNLIEQERLQESLSKAVKKINTGSEKIKCLDFGCGAGNLTRHLLELGAEVHAADVSNNFLNLVKKRFEKDFPNKIFTVNLNGEDLSGINNDSFDFVATYSVLHHVPDYLKAVKELCRVLKPGGILYIDHEAPPGFWNPDKDYIAYSKELKKNIFQKTKWRRFFHFFIPKYWIYGIRSVINPRFRVEGDIHIFSDDHVEWKDIGNILAENKLQIIREEDYLLYRRHCPDVLYEKYRKICNDERFLIARKML